LCEKQNSLHEKKNTLKTKNQKKGDKTITHKFYEKLLSGKVFDYEREVCEEVSLPSLFRLNTHMSRFIDASYLKYCTNRFPPEGALATGRMVCEYTLVC
jgi:hypothetical protein